MSTATKLITAEEFARMSGLERPCELVRGEILETDFPPLLHGVVCAAIGYSGADYRDRIHILLNNVGVLTNRDPDTVRCPDVIFITQKRLPKNVLRTADFLAVPPEIVFEVVSPSDSWMDLQAKTSEFLDAGVLAVCIADPETETVQVFRPDHTGERLSGDDVLTFPDILPEFSVPVRKFFE